MRRALIILAGLLIIAGLVMTGVRVDAHANREVSATSDPQTVASLRVIQPRHELVAAQLYEGQHVEFHACSSDGFSEAHWPMGQDGVVFELWLRDPAERMLTAPVDETRRAAMRRGERGACVQVGAAAPMRAGGEFSIAIRPRPAEASRIEDARVWAQILAVVPLGPDDALWSLLVLLGGLLAAIAWALPTPPASEYETMLEQSAGAATEAGVDAPAAGPPRLVATKVVALAIVAYFAGNLVLDAIVGAVASPGSGAGLLSGALHAAYAAGLAVLLARRTSKAPLHEQLALRAPTLDRRWLAGLLMLSMLPAGVMLRWVARVATGWIPSTGVSPIEAFVAAPSGMLATVAVAFLAPVAEELFFRGLLYGRLRQTMGAWGAGAITVLLFTIVHLPQTWGAWSGFVSVALLGIAATAVRAVTGSTAASSALHLAHNFTVMSGVVFGALAR